MADYEMLEINDIDGVTVARVLVREIAESKIQSLTEEFGMLAEEPRRERFVIDLGAVSFLTSSAIGALIALNKRLHAGGKALKLCNLHPEIRSLFTITQVDRLFDIRANKEDAVASFS